MGSFGFGVPFHWQPGYYDYSGIPSGSPWWSSPRDPLSWHRFSPSSEAPWHPGNPWADPWFYINLLPWIGGGGGVSPGPEEPPVGSREPPSEEPPSQEPGKDEDSGLPPLRPRPPDWEPKTYPEPSNTAVPGWIKWIIVGAAGVASLIWLPPGEVPRLPNGEPDPTAREAGPESPLPSPPEIPPQSPEIPPPIPGSSTNPLEPPAPDPRGTIWDQLSRIATTANSASARLEGSRGLNLGGGGGSYPVVGSASPLHTLFPLPSRFQPTPPTLGQLLAARSRRE